MTLTSDKKIMLNLILKNPYKYKTCHHIFWFSFSETTANLLLSEQLARNKRLEKTVFNYAGGFLNRLVRLKFEFFLVSYWSLT